MPRPSKKQCIYCDGTGQIRDRGIFETCHNCAGTGNGRVQLVEIDPADYREPDPKEDTAMETTLRYTTHRDLTRKDLAAFIEEIPDDATIRVRRDTPHPMEGGTTTTTLEATWTTGKVRNA